LFSSMPSAAQVQPRVVPSFSLGIPIGDFANNVGNIGFGFDLSGGVGLPPAPIMLGVNAGFLIYGFERRSEPFSSTIPDVLVDVETTNNIAYGHLIFRIQPQTGPVQPYIDALFGFKYLFTRTSITNRRTDEEIAASTNFDDFASSYGMGAGVDIQVYSGSGERGRPYSIFVHLGARYLLGGHAEYLEKGSIRREEGNVFFDVKRSRTDLIMPQLGATFTF